MNFKFKLIYGYYAIFSKIVIMEKRMKAQARNVPLESNFPRMKGGLSLKTTPPAPPPEAEKKGGEGGIENCQRRGERGEGEFFFPSFSRWLVGCRGVSA